MLRAICVVAALLVSCSDPRSDPPPDPDPAPPSAATTEEARPLESAWLEMPFQCRAGSHDWASCRFERRDDGYALSFGHSGVRCEAVDFDEAGRPATLRGCGVDSDRGITVPSTIALTESVWGILEGETAGVGVFLKKTWPAGPFASVEAYCADVVARCNRVHPFPGGCECRAARNASSEGVPADVEGLTERSTPNLAIDHAALLRVARGITEPIACELAIRTRRGVFVLQRASSCGVVGSAGHADYDLSTHSLETWSDDRGASLLLDWEETATLGSTRSSERLRIRCTVDDAGIPRCPWRERRRDALDDLEHAPERWREVPGARSFVRRNARTVFLEARQNGAGLGCSTTSCSEVLDVWMLRGTLHSPSVRHYLGAEPPPQSGCFEGGRLFTDWTAIEIAPVAGGAEPPHCGIETVDDDAPRRWAILRVHDATPAAVR